MPRMFVYSLLFTGQDNGRKKRNGQELVLPGIDPNGGIELRTLGSLILSGLGYAEAHEVVEA